MADASGINVSTRHRFPVTTLTGQRLELLAPSEVELYNAARDKYMSENSFTAESDRRSLDRLILFEVQVFRWQSHMASGRDYDNVDLEPAEEVNLRRAIKDTEVMISQLQNDLALTKVQRDKAGSAESVADYLINLKQRAKEHGIRRDKEIGKAIELINELFSIVGSYQRSNANERSKLGFDTPEEILEWITDVMRPQYEAIDAAHRQNQKMWIRTL